MAQSDWFGLDKWSFVVDTDSYAGNFDRELCAHVIGATPELSDLRLVDPGDDGFHRAPCDLAPTPGWSNDGYGHAYRVSRKHGFEHPAYNSVAIFLGRRPTDQELAQMLARARAFPNLLKTYSWRCHPMILGCRLIRETTQLEAIPVTTSQEHG